MTTMWRNSLFALALVAAGAAAGVYTGSARDTLKPTVATVPTDPSAHIRRGSPCRRGYGHVANV